MEQKYLNMNFCILIQSTKTTIWEHVDYIQQNRSDPMQQQIN